MRENVHLYMRENSKHLVKNNMTILENLLKDHTIKIKQNLNWFPYGILKLYFFREALSNIARVGRGTFKHSASPVTGVLMPGDISSL